MKTTISSQKIWNRIQKNADQYLKKNGLPSKKLEDWKYLSLPEQIKNLASKSIISEFNFARNDSLKKYHLDGFLNIVLSSDGYSADFDFKQDGWSLISMAEFVQGKDHATFSAWKNYAQKRKSIKVRQTSFEALNVMNANQGLILRVNKNTKVEKPVLISYVSGSDSKVALVPRLFVDCASFSSLCLTERYLLSPGQTTNFVSEIYLHPEAQLNYALLSTDELGSSCGVGLTRFLLERNSRLTSHSVATATKFFRHNLDIHLVAESAEAECYGGGLVADGQVIDHHTWIDHIKGQCQTKQLYKSILSGKSQFVFDGLVKIHKDAQKANSEQLNQNLILDQQGEVNSKPQLEIEADDVKASHGSTIGQLDQEEIFYFESRAISRADAERMISLGFIKELTQTVSNDQVRGLLNQVLESSFAKLQGEGIN